MILGGGVVVPMIFPGWRLFRPVTLVVRCLSSAWRLVLRLPVLADFTGGLSTLVDTEGGTLVPGVVGVLAAIAAPPRGDSSSMASSSATSTPGLRVSGWLR